MACVASESQLKQDESVKILLWHGYLLGGTGSNVYTRQLAREWSRLGHDVVALSQEPITEAQARILPSTVV